MNITVSERLKPQYNFTDVNFFFKKKLMTVIKNKVWLLLKKERDCHQQGHMVGCQVADVSLSCFGEGNGNPLQCSCLEKESQGRGSLVGCHLWGRTELDTTEVTQQQVADDALFLDISGGYVFTLSQKCVVIYLAIYSMRILM